MRGNARIERQWITEHGHNAVVIMGSLGFRCGYVAVGPEHPLYGVRYDEPHASLQLNPDANVGKRGVIPMLLHAADPELYSRPGARADVYFDVHGSITFSDWTVHVPDVVVGDFWWFGFDAGHAGDIPASDYGGGAVEGLVGLLSMFDYGLDGQPGEHRTEEYMRDECEELSRQLAQIQAPLPRITYEA